jgi:hypothetical protein
MWFIPYYHSLRILLFLFLFYGWGNWDWERLRKPIWCYLAFVSGRGSSPTKVSLNPNSIFLLPYTFSQTSHLSLGLVRNSERSTLHTHTHTLNLALLSTDMGLVFQVLIGQVSTYLGHQISPKDSPFLKPNIGGGWSGHVVLSFTPTMELCLYSNHLRTSLWKEGQSSSLRQGMLDASLGGM